LLIADHERPIAKLVAETARSANDRTKRHGDQWKDWVMMVLIFNHLPDDIAKAFGVSKE